MILWTFQIFSKKTSAVNFLFIKVSAKFVILWDYPNRYWMVDSFMDKKNKIHFVKENVPHQTQRMFKTWIKVEKKLAALNKGSWFSQDVVWDEIDEINTKLKVVWPEDNINVYSDSYTDDIYSGGSHSPSGSKISLKRDLNQRQSISCTFKIIFCFYQWYICKY